jgi:hypothetical protein
MSPKTIKNTKRKATPPQRPTTILIPQLPPTISLPDVQRRVEKLAGKLNKRVPAYQTMWARCQGLVVVVPEIGKRPRLPEEAWPLLTQRLGLTE